MTIGFPKMWFLSKSDEVVMCRGENVLRFAPESIGNTFRTSGLKSSVMMSFWSEYNNANQVVDCACCKNRLHKVTAQNAGKHEFNTDLQVGTATASALAVVLHG